MIFGRAERVPSPVCRQSRQKCGRDARRELYHACRMDDDIPVVVRMRVECTRCRTFRGRHYEFDMPFAQAQAMEAYEPGKCPKCSALIHIHLKRTQQRQ